MLIFNLILVNRELISKDLEKYALLEQELSILHKEKEDLQSELSKIRDELHEMCNTAVERARHVEGVEKEYQRLIREQEIKLNALHDQAIEHRNIETFQKQRYEDETKRLERELEKMKREVKSANTEKDIVLLEKDFTTNELDEVRTLFKRSQNALACISRDEISGSKERNQVHRDSMVHFLLAKDQPHIIEGRNNKNADLPQPPNREFDVQHCVTKNNGNKAYFESLIDGIISNKLAKYKKIPSETTFKENQVLKQELWSPKSIPSTDNDLKRKKIIVGRNASIRGDSQESMDTGTLDSTPSIHTGVVSSIPNDSKEVQPKGQEKSTETDYKESVVAGLEKTLMQTEHACTLKEQDALVADLTHRDKIEAIIPNGSKGVQPKGQEKSTETEYRVNVVAGLEKTLMQTEHICTLKEQDELVTGLTRRDKIEATGVRINDNFRIASKNDNGDLSSNIKSDTHHFRGCSERNYNIMDSSAAKFKLQSPRKLIDTELTSIDPQNTSCHENIDNAQMFQENVSTLSKGCTETISFIRLEHREDYNDNSVHSFATSISWNTNDSQHDMNTLKENFPLVNGGQMEDNLESTSHSSKRAKILEGTPQDDMENSLNVETNVDRFSPVAHVQGLIRDNFDLQQNIDNNAKMLQTMGASNTHLESKAIETNVDHSSSSSSDCTYGSDFDTNSTLDEKCGRDIDCVKPLEIENEVYNMSQSNTLSNGPSTGDQGSEDPYSLNKNTSISTQTINSSNKTCSQYESSSSAGIEICSYEKCDTQNDWW